MNILLSALINHFLSIAEQELIKNEPKIVQSIENELKLLIIKIENLISNKSSNAGSIVNPILNKVELAADSGINAFGNSVSSLPTSQS